MNDAPGSRWPALLGLVLLAGPTGCDGDVSGAPTDTSSTTSDTSSTTSSSTSTTTTGPPELDWQPCPVDSSASSGTGALCAEVSVPAFWDQPEGPTITLFVKRIAGANPARQVWLLNGGPGAAGSDFEPMAEQFVETDPTLEVFLPDHRGVGRSSRLSCPDQEDDSSDEGLAITAQEWPACLAHVTAEWGSLLDGFTTTGAAHDLGYLIEQTGESSRPVIVWGGSYGTYWLQRYLQLYPDQADAAAMLGITNPLDNNFAEYDALYDQVGSQYVAKCALDPSCVSKLGAAPVTRMGDVLASLEQGHCPQAVAAGLDRDTLRSLFAYLILWPWADRVVLLAVLHRLERCDVDDQAALGYLGAAMHAPVEPDINDRLQSTVLGNHISISELFWDAPSLAELEQLVEQTAFSFSVGPRLRALSDGWPVYPADPYWRTLPDADLPMLMHQGELDPATPLVKAQVVGDHLSGPGQHWVMVPNAPHSFASPMATGENCQYSQFFFYVQDPEGPIYDCLDAILPLDFTGTVAQAQAFLGTTDLWGGAGAAAKADPPMPSAAPGIDRARRWVAATRRGRLP